MLSDPLSQPRQDQQPPGEGPWDRAGDAAAGAGTAGRPDDAELLRNFIASADDLAFGRLVARHAQSVRRIALLETGNAAAAEDVTQAAFIVLSRRPKPALRSIRRSRSLETWLHQVARYAAANWRRAESRRKRREHTAAVPEGVRPPDPSQGTDLAEAVAAALRTLRRRDRRLILLRHVEEKPWSEVAAATGLSAEAARKATDRAMQRLRDLLADQGITATPYALTVGLAAMGTATSCSAALVAAPTTASAISTSELAKGAMIMMNLKTTGTCVALGTALALTGAIVASSREATDPATATPQVAQRDPIRVQTLPRVKIEHPLTFTGTPAADALAFLAETTGARIELDEVSLERAGLRSTAPVHVSLGAGSELYTVLRTIAAFIGQDVAVGFHQDRWLLIARHHASE